MNKVEHREEADNNNNNRVIIHWSELCSDMVELLARRLATPRDYMSFRGVCESWRSQTPPLRLPWLMLHDDPKTRLRRFYSPIEDCVHSFDIPEIYGCFCCGYSKRWLVLFHKETNKISLMNPFSGGSVCLPSLPKLHTIGVSVREHRKWRQSPRYIHKLILSKAPTSPDCVVVIIFGRGYLACCRPGDKKWILLDVEVEGPFLDVIFYKDQLLACCEFGLITVFDVDEPYEDSSWDDVLSVLPKDDEYGGPEQRFFLTSPDGSQVDEMENMRFYMVESCRGDLLLALQLKHDLSKGEDIKNSTVEFLLFRLDNSTDRGPQWVRLESLGEEALFLGKNESRSLAVPNDDGSLQGLRKNCIYFTEFECGSLTGNTEDPHWDLDMGVYSFEDRSVSNYIISKEPYLIGGGKQVWESPPIWLN
ncbi:hypothetical protein QJS10_CPB15g01610 [Acorus calamus]|uniref:KIB1-4 beta-propeller domain-containing protein n=1 Tax=Acorus calamus TaxID=4465 RepID=A0AAV9D8C4_ACOCL|nr:hypothetical protein QJS10_CPB15g01610 [Acorus calamus]